MLIFMICATRTNVIYTLIFLSLFLVFILLTSGYWKLGEGNMGAGDRCVKVSLKSYSSNLGPADMLDHTNSNFSALGGWGFVVCR